MSTNPTTQPPVRAVMIFARYPEASCQWYTEHVMCLSAAAVQTDSGFWFIETGGVEVGFHPADDDRNPFGASVVPYFRSTGVAEHRSRLLQVGATAHRGPLVVDDDRSICQLTDPFGTVFGLDGPA